MLRIFLTGDNHFGKKYDRYPDVRQILVQSRLDSLRKMVDTAEKESCGLFVVSGDLFDKTKDIPAKDIKAVAEVLAGFDGTVAVLPGNHDFYTGEEPVWKVFEETLASMPNNVLLLKEYKTYELSIGEEQVILYPCFCQSKHGKENNLSWIEEWGVNPPDAIHIGIAHGAIEGVTPDMKEEYFLMTEKELLSIPMDAWLIGHTHIPYPFELTTEKDTEGYRIFNAGTHEQTDLHNDTEGYGFLLSITKIEGKSTVAARKIVTGNVRFHDLSIRVTPSSEKALENALRAGVENLNERSVIRVKVSGSCKSEEFFEKDQIANDVLGKFLTYETDFSLLTEEITEEKIRKEFSETSFACKFAEAFLDDPIELQMVYSLLAENKEK